jgi:K+-transporting ATPase ATPase A chain
LVGYMTSPVRGRAPLPQPRAGPVERGLYRLAGVNGRAEQHWVTYGAAMLLFNALGLVLLYGLQRLQHVLPLNPQNLPAV